MTVEERIKERIAALKEEREDLLRRANGRMAYLAGAIAELEEILKDPPENPEA